MADDGLFDEEDGIDTWLPDIQRVERVFDCSLFGYQHSLTLTFASNFVDVLRNLDVLELYCDAPTENSWNYDACTVDLSIGEALQCPRRLAERTPMQLTLETRQVFSATTLKSMYCRLVSHYFEWLAGIPELRYLPYLDKIRLVTRQLCRVICFSVAWRTYDSDIYDGIYFGGGFQTLPVEECDPTIRNYVKNLGDVIQNRIVNKMRRMRFKREEYLLVKLTILFSQTDDIVLSESGREIVLKALKKYTEALVDLCRTEEHHDGSLARRMRDFISIIPHLDTAGEVDNQHLAELTINNGGNLQGQLTNEIHVHSRH